MNVTQHQRPGVYSVYDASSAVSGRRGAGAVGIVAVCGVGDTNNVHTLTSYQEAAEIFVRQNHILSFIKAIFENGAGKVYAIPILSEKGYDAGYRKLEEIEDIKAIVCDVYVDATQVTMRESAERCAKERRERMVVIGGTDEDSVTELVNRAGRNNSERVVLVGTGGPLAAAAFAGAMVAETDPAMPLNGIALKGLPALPRRWTESEIDALVLGGVTPLEESGGTVNVVRAVTTRTKTGSAADTTWREVTTMRIIDDVIPGLRNALGAKFSRAKNTEQGRGAIRSQVVVELEKKKAQEIIAGYGDVTVSAVEEDPTVCLVEFSFSVAHGLSQIWLSAHITV